MDRETQRKIDEINAAIPEEYKKNLVSSDVDEELLEQKEMAEYTLKQIESGLGATTGKITAREQMQLRNKLKGFLQNTDFTKKVEKVNPNVAHNIDQFLRKAMEQEIKRGRLNPASKSDVGGFMKKMLRK